MYLIILLITMVITLHGLDLQQLWLLGFIVTIIIIIMAEVTDTITQMFMLIIIVLTTIIITAETEQIIYRTIT